LHFFSNKQTRKQSFRIGTNKERLGSLVSVLLCGFINLQKNGGEAASILVEQSSTPGFI